MNRKTRTIKTRESSLLYFGKKLRAIELLGGKCELCGEKDPFVLEFHHKDPSKKELSFNKMRGLRWSIIEKEIKKCSLLCANCHCELHYKGARNGRIFESFVLGKNLTKCKKCGYSGKNFSSLHFHHRDPDSKEFEIGAALIRKTKVSVQELNDEVEKCDVLCSNCHRKEHIDQEFYLKRLDEINKKSVSYKETRPKLDRKLIWEMYLSGMRQVDICKKLNASKGTISPIIKKMKQKNQFIP